MRIISFIEDETTIKKILMYLNFWMTYNHDPPNEEKTQSPVHIEKPKSLQWWETVKDTPCQENFKEGIYQMPYEDEYSQLTPYED